MHILALVVVKVKATGQPAIRATAVDDTRFGFFQRKKAREVAVFVGRTFSEGSQSGKGDSFPFEEYMVHRFSKDGLCLLAVTDDHYPQLSAATLLRQVLDEYQKTFRDSWSTAEEDCKEPWSYLNEALTRFQDPAEADKLLKILSNLQDTKLILHQTLDSVTRGNIGELSDEKQ